MTRRIMQQPPESRNEPRATTLVGPDPPPPPPPPPPGQLSSSTTGTGTHEPTHDPDTGPLALEAEIHRRLARRPSTPFEMPEITRDEAAMRALARAIANEAVRAADRALERRGEPVEEVGRWANPAFTAEINAILSDRVRNTEICRNGIARFCAERERGGGGGGVGGGCVVM
ncbi:hypothetical protein BJY00DRAFT_311990 [Aspergillus carlsbadensis]|nr:hypothetical protein BJY00DRAFT_311990 [Aspergillus carlsbadensis]